MRGSDIWDNGTVGASTSYWATDADYARIQPDQLVKAAREVVRLYPQSQGAGYIRDALRENDPGHIDGEATDMIIQVHLFGEVVYG
jgi:hypothetical protein